MSLLNHYQSTMEKQIEQTLSHKLKKQEIIDKQKKYLFSQLYFYNSQFYQDRRCEIGIQVCKGQYGWNPEIFSG